MFSYTVAVGDDDTDGIAIVANKQILNGGTIEDAHGNAATLTHVAVAADQFTKFFVDEAIRKYHSGGLEATVAYYNSLGNVDGQWFALLADAQDMIISHHNPSMLGQNLDDLLGTDMFTARDEGSWVTHTDVNPKTGVEESKHAWVVSHHRLILDSGWYHGHVSQEG